MLYVQIYLWASVALGLLGVGLNVGTKQGGAVLAGAVGVALALPAAIIASGAH